MSLAIKNRVILAAAGSRKTEYIVESALSVTSGRVLITTFTQENQRQIVNRIERRVGTVPGHITVMGWFAFLIAQCAKPYQRELTGEPLFINGLNFKGSKRRFTRKSSREYFFDKNRDIYREGVSDFVVTLQAKTNGAVVRRLEKIYSHIFIDEIQDFGGYDLDVLDLLLKSSINLTLVGDPRQCTLATTLGPRNKKYRGAGISVWFSERVSVCTLEVRDLCYRCNQLICDFADAIYPEMPSTTSVGVATTGHDGIFKINRSEVASYLTDYHPVTVLRYNKTTDTDGLPALNIGVAKGSTFDRVLVFPTKPMIQFLADGIASKLKEPEKLYVAVTRARFSVAFVMPNSR